MLQDRTYTAAPELRPFVSRYYVLTAHLPDHLVVQDKLMAEIGFIRLLLRGDWRGQTRLGDYVKTGSALLFGANSRPLPVQVRGGFAVVGIALRPAGWMTLMGLPADACTDEMLPLSDCWGQAADDLVDQLRHLSSDAAIVAALDNFLLAQLARRDDQWLCRRSLAIEALSLRDQTGTVAQLAQGLNMSTRHLERHIRAHFGVAPKMLLRRQRFLSIAGAMRGHDSLPWEVVAADRYFDQSHLARDFRQFIGMSPTQFLQSSTPLLDAGLKLRRESRQSLLDNARF